MFRITRTVVHAAVGLEWVVVKIRHVVAMALLRNVIPSK